MSDHDHTHTPEELHAAVSSLLSKVQKLNDLLAVSQLQNSIVLRALATKMETGEELVVRTDDLVLEDESDERIQSVTLVKNSEGHVDLKAQ